MTINEQFVVEPHALSDALEQNNNKILYIAAATGWGKTTTIQYHFRNARHTYASLWDEDALDRAERDKTKRVILDDCHVLTDRPELQERLFALLRDTPAKARIVLLSRAPLPNWLLPFQLSGLLDTLDSDVFTLGTGDVAKMAEDFGVELSPEDALRLHRKSRGHPLTARLICLELSKGRPLNTETIQRAFARMFTSPKMTCAISLSMTA